jgi:hypothetical protein
MVCNTTVAPARHGNGSTSGIRRSTMTDGIVQVGAQDPELANSPVAWETDEDPDALREAVPGEAAACVFNGTEYEHGAEVSSGTVVLRCDHGLWLPAGSLDDAEH